MYHTKNRLSLIRLGSANPKPLKDLVKLRHHTVVGSNGNHIGTVTDFYVNLFDLTPLYLQVKLRDTAVSHPSTTLIPVVAIAGITEEAVALKEPRDQFVGKRTVPVELAQQRFLRVEILPDREMRIV